MMKIKHLLVLGLILISSILSSAQTSSKNNFITISIQTDHHLKWNTLTLSYWKSLVDEDYKSYQVKAHKAKDNRFYFKIPRSANNILGYVNIINEELAETEFKHYVLINYLVERGDSVALFITSDSLKQEQPKYSESQLSYTFSGVGYEKYEFKRKIEHIYSDSPTAIITPNYEYNTENNYDKALTERLSVLDSYRNKIEEQVYWILRADLIGDNEETKLSIISSLLRGKGKLDADKVKSVYENYRTNSPLQNLPIYAKGLSVSYSDFLLYYERLFYQLKNKSNRVNYGYEFYNLIKHKYAGALRDKLITLLCINSYALLSESKAIVDDALKTIESPDLLLIINKIASKNKAEHAYNFLLPDEKGVLVSLNQFKGKVVFIDFWFTGCTGCTNYYKNVLKYVEEHYVKSKDVVFITISTDVKREQWIRSIKQNIYTSQNVINLFTEGKGIHHQVVSEYNMRSGPTPMLISRDGKMISYKGPELYNKESLIKVIEAAKSN